MPLLTILFFPLLTLLLTFTPLLPQATAIPVEPPTDIPSIRVSPSGILVPPSFPDGLYALPPLTFASASAPAQHIIPLRLSTLAELQASASLLSESTASLNSTSELEVDSEAMHAIAQLPIRNPCALEQKMYYNCLCRTTWPPSQIGADLDHWLMVEGGADQFFDRWTDPEIRVWFKKGDSLVFVCNMGSHERKKTVGWWYREAVAGLLDRSCGSRVAGHWQNPETQMRYGRTVVGLDFCSFYGGDY